MTWTKIPKRLHNGIVIGYRVFIWKQSEGNESSDNVNVSFTTFFKHLDGLEKWTFYCGQVAGFTRIGIGPRSMVQCTRTFEDGKIKKNISPFVRYGCISGQNSTITNI